MPLFSYLFGSLFCLSLGGLVLFCLLFGTPVLAQFPASWVLEFAGCSAGSFDIRAQCPPGSFAEPFIPLASAIASVGAPLILLANFAPMLFRWLIVSLVLGLACLIAVSIEGS